MKFGSTVVLVPIPVLGTANALLSHFPFAIDNSPTPIRRLNEMIPGSSCAGSEGAWYCMANAFQRCASGEWSRVMSCAPGTICEPEGLTYGSQSAFDIASTGVASSDGGGDFTRTSTTVTVTTSIHTTTATATAITTVTATSKANHEGAGFGSSARGNMISGSSVLKLGMWMGWIWMAIIVPGLG